MNFYYLHIWTGCDLDQKTVYETKDVHPPIVEDIGLEIDFWPADDLFHSFPVFFVTERLKAVLTKKKFEKFEFTEIKRLQQGLNFIANYPNTQLGRYWHLDVQGTAGVDDFGLWGKRYLVVSDKALDFLRANRVTHAESDLLPKDLEGYFNSERKDFWTKC